MKTLQPVTMQQLTDWVEKNKHHTWNHDHRFGKKAQPSTLAMKYLYFCLDTRDMKIFHMEFRGFGDKYAVDFRDEGEGTLLDKMQEYLDKIK